MYCLRTWFKLPNILRPVPPPPGPTAFNLALVVVQHSAGINVMIRRTLKLTLNFDLVHHLGVEDEMLRGLFTIHGSLSLSSATGWLTLKSRTLSHLVDAAVHLRGSSVRVLDLAILLTQLLQLRRSSLLIRSIPITRWYMVVGIHILVLDVGIRGRHLELLGDIIEKGLRLLLLEHVVLLRNGLQQLVQTGSSTTIQKPTNL